MTTTDGDTIAAAAQGLRDLADFIEQHPDLEWGYSLSDGFNRMLVPTVTVDDAAATIAAFARTGGTWTKDANDNHFGIGRSFGPFELHVYGLRSEVCERVVVGTRQVEKVIPTAHRTEIVEEEIVEWQCRSILAADEQSKAAA